MDTGEFILHENSFISSGKKFCIRERKNQRGKPKLYLIQLEPFQYISSLFPVPGTREEYTLDFKQKLYNLRKNESSINIQAL